MNSSSAKPSPPSPASPRSSNANRSAASPPSATEHRTPLTPPPHHPLTPSPHAHAAGKTHKGHAFIRRWLQELRTALPNLKVKDLTLIHASKDTIAWQRTLTGTHKAALKRIPPSAKRVTWNELFVSRFANGRIAEDWMQSDLAGVLMAKQPRK